MGLREAAQIIKDTVSMDEILGLYGYTTKGGFMPCPFHAGDRDPSLKVYKGSKGWHCFGCGLGGSVIDFVIHHDGSNFASAVKGINEALELGLLSDEDPLDFGAGQALEAKYDAFMADMLEMIETRQKLIDLDITEMTAKAADIEVIPKHYRTAKQWTELMDLYDTMQQMDYYRDKLDDIKEEVRLWRTEKRRQAARKAR